MLDSETNSILRLLRDQWENFKAELTRLHPVAEVRPSDAIPVFRPVLSPDPNVVRFELGPVVFNLPERAGNNNTDLYVVVRGKIGFDRADYRDRGALSTHDFATEVAYFRYRREVFVHVYGIHHDFANDELGHPVFHSQLKGFPGFSGEIERFYPIKGTVKDCMRLLLKTARLPTAQMDLFSVAVQLCADHLLYEHSGPEEKAAFNSLLRRNEFCNGAAFRFPRLGTDKARKCYRALHWYPSIT